MCYSLWNNTITIADEDSDGSVGKKINGSGNSDVDDYNIDNRNHGDDTDNNSASDYEFPTSIKVCAAHFLAFVLFHHFLSHCFYPIPP